MRKDLNLTLFRHDSAGSSCSYIWPVLARELQVLGLAAGIRVFDLGCGNGTIAALLDERGLDVTGVDPSPFAIDLARSRYPHIRLELGSAYDDLAGLYGRFPLVISIEVIEHVFDPRHFARTLFNLVEPGGVVIVSTPYHGYLKNVALALSGRFESHFTVLWDGGHIKFFSIRTLNILLSEAGFSDLRYIRVGRIPAFAKSMIAVGRKARA